MSGVLKNGFVSEVRLLAPPTLRVPQSETDTLGYTADVKGDTLGYGTARAVAEEAICLAGQVGS